MPQQMIDRENLEYINTIGSDLRSDVVAAGMVDNGIDPDRIVVLRRQPGARKTDKEIVEVDVKRDYEGNGKDVLLMRTNRPGIYDNLPEGLFHDTAGQKSNSRERVLETLRDQQKKEFYIRRFFSLYEAEVERTRIDLQLTELGYDRPGKHRTLADTLAQLWPVVRQMDLRTALLFVRTIPHVSDIRNRHRDIAGAISRITGYGIHLAWAGSREIPQVRYPRLGAMRLGVNALLKGTFPDRYIRVGVTPHREHLKELLPGGERRRILEELLRLFLPHSADFRIVVIPRQEDRSCRPSHPQLPCILGVNSTLKRKITTDESKEQ